MDQKEINRRQRIRRAKNGNEETRRYEKTKSGFLMRLYRNMRSRVTGVQRKKAHLYLGKGVLPKEEFYAWARKSRKFHRLFARWEELKYPRKLTPAVDRIDSALGYSIDNMQWLTHSQNSSKTSQTKRKDDETKKSSIDSRLPLSSPR